MTSSTEQKAQTASPLELLGISPLQEAVYRGLLRAPGITEDMLSLGLKLPAADIASAVVELERKGFVTFSPERISRLFPSPPDIAIDAILLHRQKEMHRARLLIADLQHEQASAVDAKAVVEMIDADPAAQAQPYAQCHSRANREVLCLIRPPFLVSAPNRGEHFRAEARRRGVRYRNIVHPDTLALPGWQETLRRDCEAGEEVRLLSDFPFKMIVADRELGLLPLKIAEPYGAMLLLRSSAVLDALCELFETLWTRAAPIHFTGDGSYSIGGTAGFPPQLETMISLLAAGVQDKVAADRLGMSERTFVRRLELLYQTLNARSRFQAGWLAAALSARSERSN